jgi:hypothetical protein
VGQNPEDAGNEVGVHRSTAKAKLQTGHQVPEAFFLQTYQIYQTYQTNKPTIPTKLPSLAQNYQTYQTQGEFDHTSDEHHSPKFPFQNIPKLGFLVRKYTIWQPCSNPIFRVS